MDFSEAENVGLLNVKDGDIIVLTIPGRLTQQALEGCEYYVRDKLKEYGLNVNMRASEILKPRRCVRATWCLKPKDQLRPYRRQNERTAKKSPASC